MIAPCPYTLPTVSLVGGTTTPLLFDLDYVPSMQRADFAVINFIFKYGEPLITMPMTLANGKLGVILPSNNTMKMWGKYIYQVTIQNADGTRKVLQGLLYVHKNINANDSGVDPYGDRTTIWLVYNSEHGHRGSTQWTRKVAVWSGSDYTLTAVDLPRLSEDGWSFTGWDRQIGDTISGTPSGSGVATIEDWTEGPRFPAHAAISGLESGQTYSAGDSFYVTCSLACAVGISFDDGDSFMEMRAVPTGEANRYMFTLPTIIGDFKIGIQARGDLDYDGNWVGGRDVTLLELHLAGTRPLTGMDLCAADTNCDGNVDDSDLERLDRWTENQAYPGTYEDNCTMDWNTSGGIAPGDVLATINASWTEVVDENIYVYYGQAVPVDATTGDPDRDATPDITGFTKEAIAPDSGLQHTITFSTNTGANEYSYFLAPNRFSAVAFRYMFPDQGTPWPGGYTEMTDISMTIGGEAYRVWRSTNANLGAMNTTVELTIANSMIRISYQYDSVPPSYPFSPSAPPDMRQVPVSQGSTYTLTEDDLPTPTDSEGNYTFDGWYIPGPVDTKKEVGDTVSVGNVRGVFLSLLGKWTRS